MPSPTRSDSPSEPRTVVVTGASAGLGKAIACAFGELGWSVAVGARRLDRLNETAAEVERRGGTAFAHVLDVADPESVERFFDASEKQLGVATAVVNNAGLSYPGLAHELRTDSLAHEVAVNLLGPMYTCRRAIPAMLKKGAGGDLVHISSDASVHARPQQSTYTATKSGLEGYHRALAMELEGTGIRSTVVRPGPALSEYASSWDAEKIPALLAYWQHYGLQRHGGVMSADAVARAVVLAVTTPRGVVLDTIEVQPEAPVAEQV
jgi:NADP-dependent 3-hydroxy acid dehydrogenase YdfG